MILIYLVLGALLAFVGLMVAVFILFWIESALEDAFQIVKEHGFW